MSDRAGVLLSSACFSSTGNLRSDSSLDVLQKVEAFLNKSCKQGWTTRLDLRISALADVFQRHILLRLPLGRGERWISRTPVYTTASTGNSPPHPHSPPPHLQGTKIVFRTALKKLHVNRREEAKHFQQLDGISFPPRLRKGQKESFQLCPCTDFFFFFFHYFPPSLKGYSSGYRAEKKN